MQLKIKRSQREGGVMSKTAIFCIDARVVFTPEEKQRLVKYKLFTQVIYNSEAAKHSLALSEAAMNSGTFSGALKGFAHATMAAMKLNISIDSLERGQHVECKSLDELLGAEEAVMIACRNLKGYLDTAATFDGREILVDFESGEPELVASATPQPAIVMQPTPVATGSTASLPPPTPAFAAEVPLYAREAAPDGFDSLSPEKKRLVVIVGILFVALLLYLYFHSHH